MYYRPSSSNHKPFILKLTIQRFPSLFNIQKRNAPGYLDVPGKIKNNKIKVDLDKFKHLSKFRKKVGNFRYCGNKKISIKGINRLAISFISLIISYLSYQLF